MRKSIKSILVFVLICLCSIGFISCSCHARKEYTVSYMVGSEIVTTQTIEEGGLANVPTAPEKEDYTFMGWCVDEACMISFDFATPITDNVTLYAKFLENFKATFIVDGEAVDTQSIERGKTAVEPTKAPEKDGYAFIGWYADETYTALYDFATVLEDDVSVYAYFKALHTVSFIVDGEVFATQSIIDGEKAQEPASTPEKDYFVFKKWCATETGTFSFDFETPIFEDTNVYALLAPAYKVTYIDVDGVVVCTQLVEEGTIPVLPSVVEKEGYKVKACYYDAEFTNQYLFDTVLDDGTALYVLYDEIVKIYTANALREIANRPEGFYRLAADINLEGEAWMPIENLSGEIDGNGHTISQFTMTTTTNISGFVATNNGVLKNINFTNMVVNASTTSSSFNAGALVGVNNGTVENCTMSDVVITYTVNRTAEGNADNRDYYFAGMIGVNNGEIIDCNLSAALNINTSVHCTHDSGSLSREVTIVVYIGGLIGKNENVVRGSSANVIIDGSYAASGAQSRYFDGVYGVGILGLRIGGFTGWNRGVIEDCKVNAVNEVVHSVKNARAFMYSYIGGFVSVNNNEINRCSAKGIVNEQGGATTARLGGFVSENTAIIKDCYAESEINCAAANSSIGGFAYSSSKNISSSYAISKITVDKAVSVGGFIAENQANSTINACFASTDITYTTSVTNLGAFAGITASNSYYEKCHYNSDCKIMQGETEVEYEETNANVSALSGAELYSAATIFDSLWWNKDIWVVDGVNPPKFA